MRSTLTIVLLIAVLCSYEQTMNSNNQSAQAQYTSLEKSYCSALPTLPSINPGSPLDWVYTRIFYQPDQLNTNLMGKYNKLSAAFFGIFIIIAFIALLIGANVVHLSKVYNCIVPKKKSISGVEKIVEIALMVICASVSIAACIYSVKAQKLGNSAKCQAYHTIDESIIGDSSFPGIHQINNDLQAALNYQKKLSAQQIVLQNKSANLSASIESTKSSINLLSDMSPDLLQVTDPANLEKKIIPIYLTHLSPLAEEGTITHIMNEEYDKEFGETSARAQEFNATYMAYQFDPTNKKLSDSMTNIKAFDLYGAFNSSSEQIEFNKQLNSVSINLIIHGTVILALMGGIAILHVLAMIFPMKVIGILQFYLIYALVIDSLYIGAVSFIVGANTAQTCYEFKEAINSKDEYQNYIILWATRNTNQALTFCKSCLFANERTLAYYLQNLNFDYMAEIADNLTSKGNAYKSIIASSTFNDEPVQRIRSNFEEIKFNPINQSEDALSRLNSLNSITESTNENCTIHDFWVFNESDCLVDYPILNSSIPIGDNVCLVLTQINNDTFSGRYKDFIEKCDASNQISALYNPLYSYAQSIVILFDKMVHTYDQGFLSNWENTQIELQSMNEFASKIIDLTKEGKSVLTNYTTPLINANINCSIIQKSVVDLKNSVCKWNAAVSMYCMLVWLFGVIGILYGLLRVNYIRYIKYRLSLPDEDRQVKFLPSDDQEEQANEIKT